MSEMTEMSEGKRLCLSEVKEGGECVVLRVNGQGGFRHRIMEMGFVRGEKVVVLKNAPLQDPIEYKVMQSHVSLRRAEAEHIEVLPMECAMEEEDGSGAYAYNGTISERWQRTVEEMSKTITVALVGNPNCGKTSLFNHATGLREHVGNYSGVTVASKTGVFYHKGYTINLVDLPGTYSITEYSAEEMYVREYITERHLDVVLNVVDAGNLERNLFLTTQLIDMNVRMVMALNLYDTLEKSGGRLDTDQLERIIGFPCVPTVARTGEGIGHVLDHIVSVYEDSEKLAKHIHINYGAGIEEEIGRIKGMIAGHGDVAVDYPFRYVILKLIEGDRSTEEMVEKRMGAEYGAVREAVEESRGRIEEIFGEDAQSAITNAKYGFIRGALKETLTLGEGKESGLEYKADRVLTHKWLGIPLMLLFLFIMFEATFILGAYPQEWIEWGVEWIGETARGMLGEGMLGDLITDGIIAGVGGVIVFLPNIVILFFFIAILEDTGYMARAAFIMDRAMHKVGLHGKSFIPMLSGFGCGVPAIMATRTLESRKDRIITMMAIPFMSCSARLPVYLVLAGAFFEERKGMVVMGIYVIGILFAMVTAVLLRRTRFGGEEEQFVMELPPYRIPTAKSVAVHMWDKAVQYLKKMGSFILVASVIIWGLTYFPRAMDGESETAHRERSYIGQIGKAIEPVVEPLGFDWRVGVSLVTGLAAKEVIVSSMGILYNVDGDTDDCEERLAGALRTAVRDDGGRAFSGVTAFGLMLFVLLCCPCVAAVSALAREVGWKWALLEAVWCTGLAWVVSFLFYRIGGAIWGM